MPQEWIDPNDLPSYEHEPHKTVEIGGRIHYIYRCDDGSECGCMAESPPRKTKIKKGYSWVCGECRGNFL